MEWIAEADCASVRASEQAVDFTFIPEMHMCDATRRGIDRDMHEEEEEDRRQKWDWTEILVPTSPLSLEDDDGSFFLPPSRAGAAAAWRAQA